MAASLLSTRPGNGEDGGQCIAYAGVACFGIRFGANYAKEIWTNKTTNTGGALPYTKYTKTMPSPPCCIVWGNSPDGHVGVIESSTGSGTNKKYTFSDSNRAGTQKVIVVTGKTEAEIKGLVSSFSGYVQFD